MIIMGVQGQASVSMENEKFKTVFERRSECPLDYFERGFTSDQIWDLGKLCRFSSSVTSLDFLGLWILVDGLFLRW